METQTNVVSFHSVKEVEKSFQTTIIASNVDSKVPKILSALLTRVEYF